MIMEAYGTWMTWRICTYVVLWRLEYLSQFFTNFVINSPTHHRYVTMHSSFWKKKKDFGASGQM